MKITVCGYCGRALVGQNIGNRNRRPDGGIYDGQRRLHCTSYSHGGCPVPGSCSVAPIERALMNYCSDMINLQTLYGGDRAAAPRAQISIARAKIEDLATKLERLTDAMLEASADGTPPTAFTKRARELEAEKSEAERDLASAERELASAARTELVGADALWRNLAAGVESQDYDARIQARQLVADTFERIVVYRRGVNPEATPRGMMDLMLLAKGGTARVLRIDDKGGWVAAESFAAE